MQSPIEFLATRRSIPAAFLGDPGPTGDELRRILTVGARVPDHGKLAPWRFLILRGDARLAAGVALAAIRRGQEPLIEETDEEAERTRFTKAPVVVAVISRIVPSEKAPEWEQVLSAGAVAMNILNAAHAMGFAANWLTDWPVYHEGAKRLFGLGPQERLVGFVHIGTPKAPPQERWRPDIDQLVTEWRPPA